MGFRTPRSTTSIGMTVPHTGAQPNQANHPNETCEECCCRGGRILPGWLRCCSILSRVQIIFGSLSCIRRTVIWTGSLLLVECRRRFGSLPRHGLHRMEMPICQNESSLTPESGFFTKVFLPAGKHLRKVVYRAAHPNGPESGVMTAFCNIHLWERLFVPLLQAVHKTWSWSYPRDTSLISDEGQVRVKERVQSVRPSYEKHGESQPTQP